MNRIIKIVLVFLFPALLIAQQNTTKFVPKFFKQKLPFGLTIKVPECKPRVALALSGGGARAVVALGVIKALEENNIPIEFIVGTSMGSIIGGLYSSGYTVNELEKIITSTDWNKFYSSNETSRNELYLDQKITEDVAVLSLKLDGFKPILPRAFNSGQRFKSFLNYYTLNAPLHTYNSFDELKYRFRAVSTDLTTGKMVVLGKGSLGEALRASSSVTFLLEPVKIDSMLLVDGGLVANVPTKAAKNLGSNYIIAVDATSKLRKAEDLNSPLKIADQIVSIPMSIVTKENLKLADVIIKPDFNGKKNDDFTSLDSLIELGYNETLKKIDKIKSDLKQIRLKGREYPDIYIGNLIPYNSASVVENRIINNFANRKIITMQELFLAIVDEFDNEVYKTISAELITESCCSKLKIEYELNPAVTKIKLYGVRDKFRSDVLKLLFRIKDVPYSVTTLENSLIEVQRYYRKKGYPLAEVSEVNFSDSTGELFILVDEGRVDSVVISGNQRSTKALIERELAFGENEILTSGNLFKTLENLRTTNLFNSIDINVKKNDGKKIINVIVEDKLTGIIRFGIKLDNERFFQPSVDIRNENLFGTGSELGLFLFGGVRNQLYILEHKANRIFDTFLTYKIKGYYDSKNIYSYEDIPQTNPNRYIRAKTGEYRQILYGASIGIGMQAKKFGNLIAEYRYEQNRIYNITGNTVEPYNMNVAALKFSMRIDTQDKYPYPNSGSVFNTYYETSQSLLGAEVSYVKYALKYKGYFSLNNRNTIIPRIEIGFADATLPLSQQFSFGGQFSFWGFHENEYRGRQIFIASLAYRYQLPFKLLFNSYVSFRYNVGSIWAHKEEMHFNDFRHAAGFMISFDTPIGPADIGVGRSFEIDTNLNNVFILGEPLVYFAVGYFF